MQISGCLYNDFLLLSTTYENINDYFNGNDNYFSIGGDSLTATKIVKELSGIFRFKIKFF